MPCIALWHHPAMTETSYFPVHSYVETGARRLNRIRRQGAVRMRALRHRWKEAGRPEPGTLDRAIVDGLRDAMLATVVDGVARGPIYPQDLLLRVAAQLVERTEAAQAAGRETVVYDRQAVADALWARLLVPPKRRVTA